MNWRRAGSQDSRRFLKDAAPGAHDPSVRLNATYVLSEMRNAPLREARPFACQSPAKRRDATGWSSLGWQGYIQLNDSGRETSLVAQTTLSAVSRTASRHHPQPSDSRVQFPTNAPRPLRPSQVGNLRNSRLGGLRYLTETFVAMMAP